MFDDFNLFKMSAIFNSIVESEKLDYYNNCLQY